MDEEQVPVDARLRRAVAQSLRERKRLRRNCLGLVPIRYAQTYRQRRGEQYHGFELERAVAARPGERLHFVIVLDGARIVRRQFKGTSAARIEVNQFRGVAGALPGDLDGLGIERNGLRVRIGARSGIAGASRVIECLFLIARLTIMPSE